jgi:hypothetical protein
VDLAEARRPALGGMTSAEAFTGDGVGDWGIGVGDVGLWRGYEKDWWFHVRSGGEVGHSGAVGGSWYSGDRQALTREIEGYLAAVPARLCRM